MNILTRSSCLCACTCFTLLFAAESGLSERTRAWARSACLGIPVQDAPGFTLIAQGQPGFRLRGTGNQTPLAIGTTRYARGLALGADATLVVRPATPAATLLAEVGLAGDAAAAELVISSVGRETTRLALTPQAAPIPLTVSLGAATAFTLTVVGGGAGQVVLGQARLVAADGSETLLDHLPPATPDPVVPFSLHLGGKPADLAAWPIEREERSEPDGTLRLTATRRDPVSGLVVRCEAVAWAGHPAVGWVLSVENTSTTESPVIEHLRPLDVAISAPTVRKASDMMVKSYLVHHAQGARATDRFDFLPRTSAIESDTPLTLAPEAGRSSHGTLPYLNIQWPQGGAALAIGWSGQWQFDASREAAGGRLRLSAGQQTTRLRLHPGERIRTPSMLLRFWEGDDPLAGTNGMRRLLAERYLLRRAGALEPTPTSWKSWLIFADMKQTNFTEENQRSWIQRIATYGIEAYRLDGAWYDCWGGSWGNRGTWRHDPKRMPNGVRPITDAARSAGMPAIVFVEPEVAVPGSEIAREHPEFIVGPNLVDLGNPAARQHLIELFSRAVDTWGVDIWRHDMNVNPLPYWKEIDRANPDRAGMAEIRHVEGLYTYIDELRRRHPQLTFDSCTSGGCRLDLEMMQRCVVLWRTDLYTPDTTNEYQVHNAGLSLWLPMHGGSVWSPEPYRFRSVMNTGGVMAWNALQDDPSRVELTRQALAELKEVRELWLGDFVPLFAISDDPRLWMGWQLHRADLGRGFAVALRRPASPYATAVLPLRVDPAARYGVQLRRTYGAVPEVEMTGAQLQQLRVELEPESSVLVLYRRLDG